MFRSDKTAAIFYFIACVVCVLVFFGSHKWGYLVAAVLWLMLGIYLMVREHDDL